MEVCMSRSIEELYKALSEYHKNLDTISYDKVVDLFKDESAHTQISFHTWNDVIDGKDYYCVTIFQKNKKGDPIKYLAEDQDPIDIYNNLMNMLGNKEVEPLFNIIDIVRYPQIVCSTGDNTIVFPKEIVKLALDSSSDKKENNIYCTLYGEKEMYIPKSLPKKKNKTKEYTI